MKRMTCLLLTTALSAAALCLTAPPVDAAETAQPAAAQNTDWAATAALSEADHVRTMAMLRIAALRPAPEANPDLPNVTNFDAAKAGSFTKISDPLTFDNGKKVTTAAL